MYTSTALTLSEARSEKSKAREFAAPPPPGNAEPGIVRPFSVTILKSGPKPRAVTWLPSPLFRLIEIPVIRCSDSAKLVSGNLPISSAEMASTTPAESRLIPIDS